MCWGDLTPIRHLSPYPAACLLPANKTGERIGQAKAKRKEEKKKKSKTKPKKKIKQQQPNRKTNNKQNQTNTRACGANTV